MKKFLLEKIFGRTQERSFLVNRGDLVWEKITLNWDIDFRPFWLMLFLCKKNLSRDLM